VTRLAGVLAASLAAALPLALLALALLFVAVVAVLCPTAERQAMVGQLARAIKDLGNVITRHPDMRTLA
jgi:hypothetical protein